MESYRFMYMEYTLLLLEHKILRENMISWYKRLLKMLINFSLIANQKELESYHAKVSTNSKNIVH